MQTLTKSFLANQIILCQFQSDITANHLIFKLFNKLLDGEGNMAAVGEQARESPDKWPAAEIVVLTGKFDSLVSMYEV